LVHEREKILPRRSFDRSAGENISVCRILPFRSRRRDQWIIFKPFQRFSNRMIRFDVLLVTVGCGVASNSAKMSQKLPCSDRKPFVRKSGNVFLYGSIQIEPLLVEQQRRTCGGQRF